MTVKKCCITCLTCDDYNSYEDETCKHCHSDIARPSEYYEELTEVNHNNISRLNDLKDEIAKLEYSVEKFEKDWNATWNCKGKTQWELDNHEDYEV